MTNLENQRRRERVAVVLGVINLVFLLALMVIGPVFLDDINRHQAARSKLFVETTAHIDENLAETKALICDAYRQLKIEPPRQTCLYVPPPPVVPQP